jgi:DNA-binding IclR family transcriptional regulator
MAEGSKTVDQALRLLVELREGGPGTVAELGRRVGLSRSAAGRLLTSLEAHRFARRTTSGFDLGYDLLQFSAGLGAGLRSAAASTLRTLSHRFDETAALAVRDGADAVALDQVVPRDRLVNIQYRPGTRHPLALGAHGLAMLADVTADPDTLDPELVPRLAEIARTGYSVSHDELEPGVTGVAAPIVTAAGTSIASIGVIGPTSRFPDSRSVAAAVVAAAGTISEELSGTSPPPGRPR